MQQHFTSFSLQYRRTDDNAWAYFFAEKIPPDATSFVMRNLDPGSAYHIKLAAKNEFGMGEFDQYHAAVGVPSLIFLQKGWFQIFLDISR